jgi:DNA-binding NarL/FixJ family response regulator
MLVPCQKTVIIVDSMAFRRARVESFLEPWAKDENVELISLQPDDAHAKLIASDCDMLIYNVGGGRPSAYEILAEMQVLHTLRPAAALVILSDDTSQASIVAAANAGSRGYLNNSMAPGLALQALSFILHGGTYFPPAAILASQTVSDTIATLPHPTVPQDGPGEQPPPASPQQGHVSFPGQDGSLLQQQGALFDEPAHGINSGKRIAAIQDACAPLSMPEPQLTERQQAVLVGLCRGDPNKLIARNLGMTETTVKVHVREIMRKLGVYNRTQVAVVARRNGLIADSIGGLSAPQILATASVSKPAH